MILFWNILFCGLQVKFWFIMLFCLKVMFCELVIFIIFVIRLNVEDDVVYGLMFGFVKYIIGGCLMDCCGLQMIVIDFWFVLYWLVFVVVIMLDFICRLSVLFVMLLDGLNVNGICCLFIVMFIWFCCVMLSIVVIMLYCWFVMVIGLEVGFM